MGSKSKLRLSRPRKSRRQRGKMSRIIFLKTKENCQTTEPAVDSSVREFFTSPRRRNDHMDDVETIPLPITVQKTDHSRREEIFQKTIASPVPSTSRSFSTPPLSKNSESKDEDETIFFSTNKARHNQRLQKDELDGRRLVNVSHLLQQSLNFPHHGLFSCDSKNVRLIKEIRKGFISQFILKCNICQVEHTVESDKSDGKLNTNGAAVTGIINIGCGFTQLNEFASAVNMPGISFTLYKRIEDESNKIFQNECWQSMLEAGKEEAKIAIESGNVNKNNVPLITVVADGAWCRRSYRTHYNAKSGAACIVGEKTGKILFLGIRNKYCAMCNKDSSKPHLCFKNWEGSSTAMESDIIVEGFKLSMEMHGVIYANLIGDGDSSVHKKIQLAKPYGSFLVRKVECTNHLLRNYVSKLTDLAKKKFSSKGNEIPQLLKHALKTNISRLRLSVDCAIKYRQSRDCNDLQKESDLKKDIINSIQHVFGKHNFCEDYFCKGQKPHEKNLIPLMENCGLFNDIMSHVHRLANNSPSLIKNMTNNSAENYNSILAKFIGGKRVDYSKKGCYEMRCNLAGLSVNSKSKFYDRIHKAITKRSPGFHTKKYIAQLSKRSNKRLPRKRLFPCNNQPKAKRQENLDSDDNEDYGINVHALNIDSEEFERRKTIFLKRLQKNEEDIIELSVATIKQSESNLWFLERQNRLTASFFGKICKMRATTDPKNTIKALLYSSFVGNQATNYGKDHEPIARQEFSQICGKTIVECGFFIGRDSEFYLGATPDGLIDHDGIIEIKCPYNARSDTPQDAIEKKKVKFAQWTNNKFSLKRNDHYHFQIQGQLYITQRHYCYFVFWTPKGILYEKIIKDDDFFNSKMKNQLHNFYYNHYLPELLKSDFKNRYNKVF